MQDTPSKHVIAYRPLRRKTDPNAAPAAPMMEDEATMNLADFADLYLNDMKNRWKISTYTKKLSTFRLHIIPWFSEHRLHEITAGDVREWQNSLLSAEPQYSKTYLRQLHGALSSMFNYAVKYYGLPCNPCQRAGAIGSLRANKLDFWTITEFNQFLTGLEDRPVSFAAFYTLYYTGLREGELLALTPADIDLATGLLRVTKTYARINRKDYILPPKTPKSRREVLMPGRLCSCLRKYMEDIAPIADDERIFPYVKDFLYAEMKIGCEKSGVRRIRIHDLRHSHASLLIELGFNPLLIAERLGHESVQTTMQIYSHLYPNKQSEVALRLDELPMPTR